MIFVVGKHMQVLHETTESIARREQKPRARKKYALACTCSERRRENGHCRHTLAIFEDHLDPKRWRDIAPQEMRAKDAPTHCERPRIDLEREVVGLREALRRIADEPPNRGLIPNFRQFARDALLRGEEITT